MTAIRLGREVCGDLHAAEHREWLVCNGIGGYASGTVAGLQTRGYHGLLVSALEPPVGRTLMFVAALETLGVAGRSYDLATLRWRGDAVVLDGYRHVESFTLEGTVPCWRFVCEGTVLEKRIWMDQGANTTRIEYRLVHAEAPADLAIGLITDCRDYHGRTTADAWKPAVAASADAIMVESYPGAPRLHVRLQDATAEAGGTWYRGFDLARERERGLQDSEDHFHAGTLSVRIAPGATVQLVASTDGDEAVDASALERRRAHETELLTRWSRDGLAHGETVPSWVTQLVLAADQFIVSRAIAGGGKGHSIIAGYHWFSDWGRDTMISLPGLTLATGRPEIGASILRTFAGAVDQGMIPNRFPDAGSSPEFNTVDATFWFFDAVRRTVEATGDEALLAELFPVLASIIDWHCRGTRYGSRSMRRTGSCAPVSRAFSSPGWTPRSAIGWSRLASASRSRSMPSGSMPWLSWRMPPNGCRSRPMSIATCKPRRPPALRASGTPNTGTASMCSTGRPATRRLCGRTRSSQSACRPAP
jgi:predicted glycogen debranching enzyme